MNVCFKEKGARLVECGRLRSVGVWRTGRPGDSEWFFSAQTPNIGVRNVAAEKVSPRNEGTVATGGIGC